jgi:dihydrofolate reductase
MQVSMRRLVYYVACTVDGFIAREDGSFDWALTEGEHFADLLELFPETFPAHLRDMLGVRSENRRFDAVLMGRKTYEVGLQVGIPNPYPHLRQYLFSKGMTESPHGDVQLVSGDAVAMVKQLKREVGKDIWLCGGSELATRLFPEIDELILKVNPVLIGTGIPLFRSTVRPTTLEVGVSKNYGNGFRLTHYRVTH